MSSVSSGGSSGDGGPPGRVGPSTSDKGSLKVKRDYMKGKSKKKYSVADKKKIIELIEEGLKTCEIVKRLNVPESSVRNIRKKKDEIKKTLQVADRYFSGGGGGAQRAVQDTKQKTHLLVITEHFLMKWVTRRLQECVSVDGQQIRDQAKLYYNSVCRRKGIRNPEPFNASKGWLYRFRKRCGVKYALYQGEVASADVDAACDYPNVAKLIIEEGGYTLDQIFNCDETGVMWKKSAKATYIPKGMKQAPGMKLAKDRFSVLLTCNASGDYKMKPVIIYKYAKPHSYRNCDMSRLGNCVWYSNARGYMTAVLSVTWFDDVFVPRVRAYCLKKNIAFKVVLFLDNAPGHAKYLVGRHPNVQVVFLPPNTTSKLQPLDQELIANTKSFFYSMLHKKMRRETDTQIELQAIEDQLSTSEEDDDLEPAEPDQDPATPPHVPGMPPQPDQSPVSPQPSQTAVTSIKLFWKGFKIKQAVDMFCVAWSKINEPTIKHAWSALLPHLKLEQEERQRAEDLLQETTDIIRQLPGMALVDEDGIQTLIGHHSREQTIEEMLEDDEAGGQQDTSDEPATKADPSTKVLSDLLANLADVSETVEGLKMDTQNDILLHVERASKLLKEVYNHKIHVSQQSLITRYMRRQTEAQQAMRVAIDDIDIDDLLEAGPSNAPVTITPEDDVVSVVNFEGFDQDEEEALRIERHARVQGVGMFEEEGEGSGAGNQQ